VTKKRSVKLVFDKAKTCTVRRKKQGGGESAKGMGGMQNERLKNVKRKVGSSGVELNTLASDSCCREEEIR